MLQNLKSKIIISHNQMSTMQRERERFLPSSLIFFRFSVPELAFSFDLFIEAVFNSPLQIEATEKPIQFSPFKTRKKNAGVPQQVRGIRPFRTR